MHRQYDVVIIGAGIGGLVCGCYLARGGLHVLIVEQHDKPGGYCTSFMRKGYRFDVGVHYFGGIKKGILGRILDDLDLRSQIEFYQFDPTDRIVLPDLEVYIRSRPDATIQELSRKFPRESKQIKRFFSFITQDNFVLLYSKLRKLTFKELLDEFFDDQHLKAALNVLLRNIGLCAGEASALAIVIFLREYILDAGYYPIGGMQKFADALTEYFNVHGGTLVLSKKVTKVLSQNRLIKGIIIDNETMVETDTVVSNADAMETFRELVGEKNPELEKARVLKASSSAFIVYLGLKSMGKDTVTNSSNIWPFFTEDIRRSPVLSETQINRGEIFTTMISCPSSHDPLLSTHHKATVGLFAIVGWENKHFWDRNRESFSEVMITQAEEFIPSLRKHIDVKITAIPQTLYRYTSNYQGSAFGWASILGQINALTFPQKTSLQDLYLVGHWCTLGSGQGGVPKVAFSGRKGATMILQKKHRQYDYGEYVL